MRRRRSVPYRYLTWRMAWLLSLDHMIAQSTRLLLVEFRRRNDQLTKNLLPTFPNSTAPSGTIGWTERYRYSRLFPHAPLTGVAGRGCVMPAAPCFFFALASIPFPRVG